MKVLVTRPEPDASRLAARLAASDIKVMVEPMMVVTAVDQRPPDLERGLEPSLELDLEGVQALAFTSANGVRAFAPLSKERALPVFAVGAATAEAAREAGFEVVHVAAGDVEHLAALIAGMAEPEGGSIFHAAGKVVAGDLVGLLAARGFHVVRKVLYGAEPAAALSADLQRALRDGTLDAVTLYSPRTARIFAGLVSEAGLEAEVARLACYALSKNVASAAAALSWASMNIAAEPSEEALLALMEED